MGKYNADEVEKVELTRATRVKVDGAKTVKLYPKGAIVEISGNDKSQLLATGGKVVTDKKAKVTEPLQ